MLAGRVVHRMLSLTQRTLCAHAVYAVDYVLLYPLIQLWVKSDPLCFPYLPLTPTPGPSIERPCHRAQRMTGGEGLAIVKLFYGPD